MLTITGCQSNIFGHGIPKIAYFQPNESEDIIEIPVTHRLINWELIKTLHSNQPTITAQPTNWQRKYTTNQFVLASGDKISIEVWGHPELSFVTQNTTTVFPAKNEISVAKELGLGLNAQRFQNLSGPYKPQLIDSDGTVFMPHLGKVAVAGKTIQDVTDLFTVRLAEFIPEPIVYINIINSATSIATLIGAERFVEVAIHPYKKVSIPAALSSANLLQGADWNQVILFRDGQTKTLDLVQLALRGNYSDEWLLRSGDVVRVQKNRSQTVYILGEVRNPKPLTIPLEGLMLSEVLSSSNLNTVTAAIGNIHIIRSGGISKPNIPHSIQIYTLDAASWESSIISDKFAMQPGDFVIVPTDPVVRWNRLINRLLPTLALFDTNNQVIDFISNPNQ